MRDKIVREKFKSWGFKLQEIRLVHLFSGIVMWLLARKNCFIGKDYFYDLYTVYKDGKGQGFRFEQDFVFIETSAIILIFFVLEFHFWLKSSFAISRKDMVSKKITKKELHDDIVLSLNKHILRKELDEKYPDRLIIMFLNRIYDLTDFVHPGGQYIWTNSRWRETSRYIYFKSLI